MKLPNHLYPGLLSLKGVVLPSLSRNFFTALRKPSLDKPKPQFASSISQSANWFSSALVRTEEGPFRWSKFTLPFSLSCRVYFFSSHFCAAFQVTSFIAFRNFFEPLQRHSTVTTERFGSTIITSGYSRFMECSHAKQTKICGLNKCMIKELSKVTLHE